MTWILANTYSERMVSKMKCNTYVTISQLSGLTWLSVANNIEVETYLLSSPKSNFTYLVVAEDETGQRGNEDTPAWDSASSSAAQTSLRRSYCLHDSGTWKKSTSYSHVHGCNSIVRIKLKFELICDKLKWRSGSHMYVDVLCPLSLQALS